MRAVVGGAARALAAAPARARGGRAGARRLRVAVRAGAGHPLPRAPAALQPRLPGRRRARRPLPSLAGE